MKAFVIALCFLAVYVRAEDEVLTDEQLDTLTIEEAKAISSEEWLHILRPRCNPSSQYYRSAQYLSDYTDCHYFYECVGYHPVRFECPANLEFNPKLNVCDWPENSGCRVNKPHPHPQLVKPVPYLTDEQLDSLTIEEAKAISSEEWLHILRPRCNPSSQYYRSAQYLSDYTDCHYFYECVGYHPVRFECPANLEFNPKLNVCDWPENAGCRVNKPHPHPQPVKPVPYLTDEQLDSLTIEEAKAISSEEWLHILRPRCNPSSQYYRSAQYLSDYTDCHYFYECVGYHPVRFECPANLEFNPKLNVCDWPENAGCGVNKPHPHPQPVKPVPYSDDQ